MMRGRFSVPRLLALALLLVSCADAGPVEVRSPAPSVAPTMSVTHDLAWYMAEAEAAFPGRWSMDTTGLGQLAPVYGTSTGLPEDGVTCRNHYNAATLWWDGGYGLTAFPIAPPILFVGYRPGSVRSPNNLLMRRAIYSTVTATTGTDPAGNVWRFQGNFNALCWAVQGTAGPFSVATQFISPQDPIHPPVMVYRSACGGFSGGHDVYAASYSPYDDGTGQGDEPCDESGGWSGSGTQFSPGDFTGGETVTWESGVGNGGRSTCGDNARVEYVCFDTYNEVTGQWEEWGCGYITSC